VNYVSSLPDADERLEALAAIRVSVGPTTQFSLFEEESFEPPRRCDGIPVSDERDEEIALQRYCGGDSEADQEALRCGFGGEEIFDPAKWFSSWVESIEAEPLVQKATGADRG
jgi:hypothetical protein